MSAVSISVWIFMNLVFLGMCGYIYLLWSQYWQYLERQHKHVEHTVTTQSNQIYYFNSLSESELSRNLKMSNIERKTKKVAKNKKQSKLTISVVKRHSHPRFLKHKIKKLSTQKSICGKSRGTNCNSTILPSSGEPQIFVYKNQLVVQLRRVLLEESSVFKAKGDGNNPYNVQYNGVRGSYQGKSPQDLLCDLKARVSIQTLSRQDEPFKHKEIARVFPETPLFEGNVHFNTCAIVSNAGSLYKSGLGRFIDSHNVVVRFNHAPTEGHEKDVGTKTTLRIVNSQVATKEKFNFLSSSLYLNIKLLVWDPSNYSSTLEEWYQNPDFDVFSAYLSHRTFHPESNFHILNPQSQWSLWNFLQSLIPVRIRKNPPSSGFLGLALMLPFCNYVDLMEFVPSIRLAKRCHYWEDAVDISCTFGVWHPLAAEKLLTMALNIASDEEVFSVGYVRVPGYPLLNC